MKKLFRCLWALAAALLLMCGCSRAGGSEEQTQPATVRITFPEGTAVTQAAQLLSENGVCSVQDFIAAVNDTGSENEFVLSIPNPQERAFLLEGYIFPDTYDFYVGEGAEAALSRFLKNTASKLTPQMRERAQQLGYTMDEILNIAAVIQEEALGAQSMKNISSVLHNRLNSPDYPRLECDVSVFYLRLCVNPFLSEEEAAKYEPLYNTYECSGLPAGPITNPGLQAIEAALYPAQTQYYFFVTDSGGNYYYSETYAEHLENCERAGIGQ